MASLVSRQANSLEKTSTFFKFSINLIRNFATSAPPAPSAAGGGGSDQKPKRKKRKKKNLFDLASFLPNWGIGYHMQKTHWTDITYEITKINLYKDGRHGKAWGIAHKDGVPIVDAAKKMSGVHKRCWRYLPDLKKKEQSALPSPVPEAQAASVPEAQPA